MAKVFGSQIDLQKIPVLNLVPYSSGTAPSSPVAGQLWWDSTNSQLKVCTNATGPVWTQCDNVTGGTASNVADGDKGVITVSSGVWNLDNGVVTFAKMQNINNARLLGLGGAAPAPPTEVLLDVDMGFVGATNTISVGAWTGGDLVKAASSTTPTIGAGKVVLSKLGSDVTLSSIALPTTNVNMNGKYLQNLLDPVGSSDAATKNYVDQATQGLDAKNSCKAATIGNLTGALGGAAPNTLDGVTLAVNDRVLVKDQSSAAVNGIYVVNTVGTGVNGSWARATDMDAWTDVPGALTFIEQGTTNADTAWLCTADQGGTLNTTSITWTKFGAGTTYTQGTGITIGGNTIAFDQSYGDGRYLNVSGDAT